MTSQTKDNSDRVTAAFVEDAKSVSTRASASEGAAVTRSEKGNMTKNSDLADTLGAWSTDALEKAFWALRFAVRWRDAWGFHFAITQLRRAIAWKIAQARWVVLYR